MFEPVAPADQGWKRSHSFYLKLSISLNLFPISIEAAIGDPKVFWVVSLQAKPIVLI